jgi:hypothetical protein
LLLDLVEVLLENLLRSFETLDDDALGQDFFLREFFLTFQFCFVEFFQRTDFRNCTSRALLSSSSSNFSCFDLAKAKSFKDRFRLSTNKTSNFLISATFAIHIAEGCMLNGVTFDHVNGGVTVTGI